MTPISQKTCLQCGKPFMSRGKSQKFCTENHRLEWWKNIRRLGVTRTWSGPSCHCGKPGKYDGLCWKHSASGTASARRRKLVAEIFRGIPTAALAANRDRIVAHLKETTCAYASSHDAGASSTNSIQGGSL